MKMESLGELEQLIGYNFISKELLIEALTHSSYANERKINKLKCNERLEFLGDAVLELVSSDYLFDRFKEKPEGELSKIRAALVCEPALFESAGKIKLGQFVLLGKGEEIGGGRNKPSVISDAFEALLGALYLDGGMEPARKIILKYILREDKLEKLNSIDGKSKLQELVQKKDSSSVIRYEVVNISGPEHCKEFEVNVFINDVLYGNGTGSNKKTAEKNAAVQAINKFVVETK